MNPSPPEVAAEAYVREVLDHLQRAQGLIERASQALAAVAGMAGESRGLGKVHKDVRRAWYVVSDRADSLRRRGELHATGASPRDRGCS